MARFYENPINEPRPPMPPMPPESMPRPRFGGTIPSPQQMTPEQARIRALMEQLQMGGFSGEPPMQTRTPQEPRVSDIPNMTPEQIAPYNKPADDLSDAVFGGTNPFDMLMKFLRGGR